MWSNEERPIGHLFPPDDALGLFLSGSALTATPKSKRCEADRRTAVSMDMSLFLLKWRWWVLLELCIDVYQCSFRWRWDKNKRSHCQSGKCDLEAETSSMCTLIRYENGIRLRTFLEWKTTGNWEKSHEGRKETIIQIKGVWGSSNTVVLCFT